MMGGCAQKENGMDYKIFEYDPMLLAFKDDIELRMQNYERKKSELLKEGEGLSDFANGHEYFGFHKTKQGWVYREWAPSADGMYLMGDMNGWNKTDLPMVALGNGVFELYLPEDKQLFDGCHVKAVVRRGDELLERIPLYIKRVEQDPVNYSWS